MNEKEQRFLGWIILAIIFYLIFNNAKPEMDYHDHPDEWETRARPDP